MQFRNSRINLNLKLTIWITLSSLSPSSLFLTRIVTVYQTHWIYLANQLITMDILWKFLYRLDTMQWPWKRHPNELIWTRLNLVQHVHLYQDKFQIQNASLHLMSLLCVQQTLIGIRINQCFYKMFALGTILFHIIPSWRITNIVPNFGWTSDHLPNEERSASLGTAIILLWNLITLKTESDKASPSMIKALLACFAKSPISAFCTQLRCSSFVVDAIWNKACKDSGNY